MSEEAKMSKETEEFAKEFSEYLQEAARRLNAKYPGKIQDIAFIINWMPELAKEPIPKMLIETFRPEDDKFDPVKQTMEISDLLGFGSHQLVRQLLSIVLQQNVLMQQRLSAIADAKINQALSAGPQGPKLIIPGQQ